MKKENVFIGYIVKIHNDKWIKSISMDWPKTIVEKLYEFLFADKRTRSRDTSFLGVLKTFTPFKD